MDSQRFNKLLKEVKSDPSLPEEKKEDLAGQIEDLRASIPDTFVYRTVVVCLGAVSVLTVIGAIILALVTRSEVRLPEGIIALASAGVGALAGLLAPSPRS